MVRHQEAAEEHASRHQGAAEAAQAWHLLHSAASSAAVGCEARARAAAVEVSSFVTANSLDAHPHLIGGTVKFSSYFASFLAS